MRTKLQVSALSVAAYIFLYNFVPSQSFSAPSSNKQLPLASTDMPPSLIATSACNRRNALMAPFVVVAPLLAPVTSPAANAYTPDPDPLKESLYLLSRVQEATCLQERYIEKSRPPIEKMKLTLRLVDRSYRLLDQVNYVSKFLDSDAVVEATQLGYEAADALQEAIDFVNGFKQDGSAMTLEQRNFLKDALTETREKIFDFLEYLPDQGKVTTARTRVEEENKLNKDEFDPDLATDAGVYNPVVLPWINRKKTS